MSSADRRDRSSVCRTGRCSPRYDGALVRLRAARQTLGAGPPAPPPSVCPASGGEAARISWEPPAAAAARRRLGGSARRRAGVCVYSWSRRRPSHRSHSDDSYRLQPQCSLASVRCDHLRCGVCNCRKSIARRNPPIALQRFSFTIVTKQGANAGVPTGRLRPALRGAATVPCPECMERGGVGWRAPCYDGVRSRGRRTARSWSAG